MPLPDGVIYMDHAATTPVDPVVLDAMLPYFTERFGNPSSVYRLGRQSLDALETAHETVARVLGCRPVEIVFTGGGSEADNLAIKGIAYAKRRRGNHIITTAIEHHAVLHTCEQLEREGYRVTYLPVDESGLVHPEDVAAAITDETALVTMMYANNEVGTIQPLKEVVQIAHAHDVPVHTDAVQAAAHLSVDVEALGVDLLSIAAHKFYGPKGVGVLYVRRGTPLLPQTQGGGQERGRRSGTENVAGIVGMAEALALAQDERAASGPRLRMLSDRLLTQLPLRVPGCRITGHPSRRLPGHASFVFQHVEIAPVLLGLDRHDIWASSGSACTSASSEPSHVLVAMGLSRDWLYGALRLTLGNTSSASDVDAVLDILPSLVPVPV